MMRDITRADILAVESNLTFHERIDIEEWTLRRDITRKIVTLFIGVNIIVVLIIVLIYVTDTILIYNGVLHHGERTISANVIVTVVGATTVQLGSIALALSKWLFTPRNALDRRSQNGVVDSQAVKLP